MKISTKKPTRKKRLLLVGVAASPGYAIATVQLLVNREVSVSLEQIPVERVPREVALFQKAIQLTVRELTQLKNSAMEKLGMAEARIFDSHLMILQDPTLVDVVLENIRSGHLNARYAFHSRMKALMADFENNAAELIRDRALDLSDIYNRVLNHLGDSGPVSTNEASELSEGVVLTGHTLNPSTLIQLKKEQVLAFATDTGGRTSHVSILARSLQIPAVAGLRDISVKVQQGDLMIVDGTGGLVIVNPSETDLRKYKDKQEVFKRQEQELFTTRDLEPLTLDGKYVKLHANIELPLEADEVNTFGATGVGLYRSEFLYFRKDPPGRREQTEAYRYIVRKLYPQPVTIRTLDAGGDKIIPEVSATDEANPFMGWRSIRVCLDRKEIFKDQLKALLMAGDLGNLRIMFPMISSVEELRRAKAIYHECRAELREEGYDPPDLEVGIMVEVPAAVIMVEELAREVDFFSIGTNDLIQFTLAVDRSNERIASMFEPHHPAVLRMIRQVVKAAHREGITVSVCGEMVSDPLSTLLLVGLGVDELSMTPWSIMECKKIIRSISYEEARTTVNEVLRFTDTESINRYLKRKYLQKITDLGISSFITSQEFTVKDRALVKIDEQIVNLSALQP